MDVGSLSWSQQVAVMFVCTFTLDIPAVAGGVTDHGGPAHINPAAQCSLAPLQDIADRSRLILFRSGICSGDALEFS